MCDPLTAIGAAMGALQIHGQNQQAKAQVRAQEAQARAAFRTANAQQSALQAQRNMAEAQAAEKLTQDQLRAAQAASSARVSAGEAGVTGVGVNRIMSDIGQQLSSEAAVTQRNLMTQQSNLAAQQETTQSTLQAAIKQAQTPVQGPSVLDAALAIGGGALSGYNMTQSLGIGTGFALEGGKLVEKSAGWGDVWGMMTNDPSALVGLTSQDVINYKMMQQQAAALGTTLDAQQQMTGLKQQKLNVLNTKLNTLYPGS